MSVGCSRSFVDLFMIKMNFLILKGNIKIKTGSLAQVKTAT
jgi:hypothetical protein